MVDQCRLLGSPIDQVQRFVRHEWPHDLDPKKLLTQLRHVLTVKTLPDLYLSQQKLCLFRYVIVGALDKLSLRANVHLFVDKRRHLFNLIDCLSAGPGTILDLILAQEHLQPNVFDCLCVQALYFGYQVLLSLLDLAEDLNLISLNFQLRVREHSTKLVHAFLLREQFLNEESCVLNAPLIGHLELEVLTVGDLRRETRQEVVRRGGQLLIEKFSTCCLLH